MLTENKSNFIFRFKSQAEDDVGAAPWASTALTITPFEL